MSAKIEKLKPEKESLSEKVLQKEEKLIDLTLDLIIDQLMDKNCSESEEGWFCPDMFECTGGLTKERIPLILEVLHAEGHLDRKLSMGIPHYRFIDN